MFITLTASLNGLCSFSSVRRSDANDEADGDGDASIWVVVVCADKVCERKISRPKSSIVPSRKSDVVGKMGSIVGVHRGIEEAFKRGRARAKGPRGCGASG